MAVLCGAMKGGRYGLAWSPFHEGTLLSGSDDKKICLWDISSNAAYENVPPLLPQIW